MADSVPTSEQQAGDNSPIAQLLESLGMTREDLSRHSAQMRAFLTTENANSLRALDHGLDSSPTKQSSQEFPSLGASGPKKSESRHSTSVAPGGSQSTRVPLAGEPNSSNAKDSSSRRHSRRERRPEGRRRRDERGTRAPPASSPSRPKPSLDEIMQRQSRQTRRVPDSEDSDESEGDAILDVFQSRPRVPLVSPHYRSEMEWDRDSHNLRVTSGEGSQSNQHKSPDSSGPSPYYKAPGYSQRGLITPSGPAVHSRNGPDRNPTTPTRAGARTYYRKDYERPLPPSSPPAPSSPIISPVHDPRRFVSSPGPMDSDPPDEDDPDLPFRLPPGPFSDEKPDLSYAALIGRAILASKTRGLRLKDIYDYISIVFPHYKRPHGNTNSHSQKWMNAIRQNLTNTPQFHKIEPESMRYGSGKDPRESKEIRGSFWYIKDEDLPCFANGSYNRHGATIPPPQPVASAEKKKRKNADAEPRQRAKKVKVQPQMAVHPHPHLNPYHFPYANASQMPPMYAVAGHYYYAPHPQHNPDVLFPPLPPSHPHAHMIPVPVYQSTADMVFPPPPPSRYLTHEELAKMSASQSSHMSESQSTESNGSATPPPPSSASSCSQSVPELTPNGSSSSPVLDDSPTGDIEFDHDVAKVASDIVSDDDRSLGLHAMTHTSEDLDLSIEVMDHVMTTDKVEGRQATKALGVRPKAIFQTLPPCPTTPTAQGRSKKTGRQLQTRPSSTSLVMTDRSSTPPPRPSTPSKQMHSVIDTSPMRTPQSRRGQLSPTRNLGHYKNSLHPPPPLPFTASEEGDANADADDLNRTPSRRRKTSAYAMTSIFPSTPLRHGAVSSAFSPFRTPSRRVVFDPHDPSALLDDELTRLGSFASTSSGLQDSPVGFFGHTKGLLYESPNMPSPSSWNRPW